MLLLFFIFNIGKKQEWKKDVCYGAIDLFFSTLKPNPTKAHAFSLLQTSHQTYMASQSTHTKKIQDEEVKKNNLKNQCRAFFHPKKCQSFHISFYEDEKKY